MSDKPPRKKRSDAAMSGMIATAALVVIGGLTLVFVLVGG